MRKTPRHGTPPADDMNQWVRDALAHSEMGYPEVADAMSRALHRSYDRSMIYKMTVKRKVSKAEAEAISEITGYPLTPAPGRDTEEFLEKWAKLKPHQRGLVQSLMNMLAGENDDPPASKP